MYKSVHSKICSFLSRSLLGKVQAFSVMLPVLVVFQWQHDGAFTVSEFNLYKGAAPGSMQKIATVPATPVGAGVYEVQYDFQDTTPQYFGISAVNNLGESPITTTGTGGAPVLLGKPQAPQAFGWSVNP